MNCLSEVYSHVKDRNGEEGKNGLIMLCKWLRQYWLIINIMAEKNN